MTTSLDAPEEMTTARLLLRRPRLEDAPVLFASYTADPEVVRYVTWKAHERAADTRSFLEHCQSEWERGRSYPYAICRKTVPDLPFGMIHLRRRDAEVEFGYVLAKAEWNKGIMSEALTALADWALTQPGIARVAAFCDVENAGSARVMEKAGLVFEKEMLGYQVLPNRALEPRDCRLYAKIRD